MTGLDCNVVTCGYNDEHSCCRTEIDVKGTKADTTDETSCGSFKKEVSSSINSTGGPKSTLAISCEATNCVYNESEVCSADHIDISGSGANDQEQTVCSSFTCK